MAWQVAPKWTPATSAHESALTALCLKDSDLYYYKRADELVKTLSPQEQTVAEAERAELKALNKSSSSSSASSYSSSSKEKGLKIKKSSVVDS